MYPFSLFFLHFLTLSSLQIINNFFVGGMFQSNHQITTKMQRRIYGHATDVEIRPLNEEKAVQAAVDLIGELFVFSVTNQLHSIFFFHRQMFVVTQLVFIYLSTNVSFVRMLVC